MSTTLDRATPYAAGRSLPRPRLRARIRTAASITETELERMHQVFVQYYEDHPLERFRADLREKDHVILLRDAESNAIRGFSTLLRVDLPGGARGIYSGDTVVDKNYWGSTALGAAFLKFLWIEKIKSPRRPLYWLLISKGYKTYLLMANNFATHFPRYEKPTPARERAIMDAFYGTRFAGTYDPRRGLIVPEGSTCRLREKIADVTPALLENSRVRFFAETNPDWPRGVELACLARMSLWMPLKFLIRRGLKGARR